MIDETIVLSDPFRVVPDRRLLPTFAQTAEISVRIEAAKGVDPTVDYPGLKESDRGTTATTRSRAKDLALLAPNEREQRDPIPAFFRVEMRRANPAAAHAARPSIRAARCRSSNCATAAT